MTADAARRRRLLLAGLAVLALAAAVTGAVLGARQSDSADEPRPSAPATASREPSLPRGVAGRVRALPLERRVAQLFVYGFQGSDSGAEILRRLARLDVGGILVGSSNYVDPAQLEALAGEASAVSRGARHLPPLVLARQEGGDLNTLPGLPPRNAPADAVSARAAARDALESARALLGAGVTGVLGPVVDVGPVAGSALGARVYSDDPEEVAAFAEATVRAYRRARVFSSVGHFPGLGAADQSTEEGPATVGLTLDELRERDLIPFAAAVDAGVPGVTLGHALYSYSDFTVPASLSRTVATDLLRDELGFGGVALTDDLADPAITTHRSVAAAAVAAVRAGADMLVVSGPVVDQRAAYAAVLRAARSGRIPPARLDTAVGRILVAKRNYGLIR